MTVIQAWVKKETANSTETLLDQFRSSVATAWTVRVSNPGGGEIFRARPERPWGPPASYTVGTDSFPGLKRPRRGVNYPPYLAPRLRKE